MIDLLRRFLLRVQRRNPPPGVEVAYSLSDITSCLEADAARQAARYEAAQRNARRRLSAGRRGSM
jgi:hypothetical protein